jgi:isopenicillin N synthase-like dioxygenase
MKVAVCNLKAADFEHTLIESVMTTGFVVVTHHGIDMETIRDAQNNWREFFLENSNYKGFFTNRTDGNLGYKGMGSETAVGSKIADLKEFFHWQPGELIPGNVSDVTVRLYHQLDDLGQQILSVLSRHAGTNYHDQAYQSDNTLLRTLYYPAIKNLETVEKGAVRAAAHEDINYITLLVAASAPGLQVMDSDGNWHDVPHEENSITVNIGDMLQLASGGKFKSTTHRVINPNETNTDRLSMPLFVHPHSATLLAPGITAGQFLQERIDQIYNGKK